MNKMADNIGMEDLNPEDDITEGFESRPTYQETIFINRMEDDEFVENIPDEKLEEESPFDESFWKNSTWAENTGRDKKKMWAKSTKITITNERKKAFRDGFETINPLEVTMADGPESRRLIKNSNLISSKNTEWLEYEGVKVAHRSGKNKIKFKISGDKKNASAVKNFTNQMEKARLEHKKTANSVIEDVIGGLPGPSVVNNIRASVANDIWSEATINASIIDKTLFTEEEEREFRGIFEAKGVESLDHLAVEAKYWLDKAEKELNLWRKKVCYKVSDLAKTKFTQIMLKKNIKEENNNELQEMIENNDLTKFEKFKKWSKENLLGLSAVAITIAGIIVTIVSATRTVVRAGASALSKFAKSIASIAQKLGPTIAAIGSVLASILVAGTKGLLWLAKNLWLLAIALTYFIYSEYKSRKNKK